ncbi:MAG: GntR family transcriptional regulator [Verrucomicrobiota bacterium]
MPKIRKTGGRPAGQEFLYLKLVKDVKNDILTGHYTNGQRLPSYSDFARDYGINRLTVRRALQELKRERLIHALPAKGVYVGDAPDAVRHPDARELQASERWTIGIVPDLQESGMFGFQHFEIIEEMRRLLHLDLHSLHILPARGRAEEGEWLDSLRRDQPTALVLIGRPADLVALEHLAREIPLVALDPHPRIDSLTTLCADDEAGGFLAGRHLQELGHTDIAVVAAPPQPVSALRLAGFERALSAGTGAKPRLRVYKGNFSADSGARTAAAILAEPRRPTAVFCLNDEMAFGCLQALAAAGVRVPADISVMGYDDVRMAGVMTPSLTTVRVGATDIARLLVDAISRKLQGSFDNEITYIVRPRLVPRASTGAPAAARRAAKKSAS